MSHRPCMWDEHRPAGSFSANRWLGITLAAGALFGMIAGWATWLLPLGGYPAWLLLAAPLTGMVILLIGLVNYDLLVLLTFSTVGFVWFEPAPFDMLLVVVLALGLFTGRLRWPTSRKGALVHIGLWGLVVTNILSAVVLVPILPNLLFLGITLYVLALFCFVRMYVIDQDAARAVLTGYLVSAVANVVVTILGLSGFTIPLPVVRFSIRGAGFFEDPNVYGPFVLVAALWVADQIVQHPFSFARTVPQLLLTGLLGAGAMLSLSRAVWINLGFGGLLYLALLLRRASRDEVARFSILAVVVLLIAVFTLQSWGLGEVMSRRWTFYGYDEARFSIQRRGIVAAFTHPIGVGPGGWPNTHSLYVRTLAEHGVLGLASLVLLIGGLMLPLVRRAWQGGAAKGILPDRLLVATIAGQLVNSVVIDSIHWRHLWILLGLAWSALETSVGQEDR